MRKFVIPLEDLCMLYRDIELEDKWERREAKYDLLTMIIAYCGTIEGNPIDDDSIDIPGESDKNNDAKTDPTGDAEKQSATLSFTAVAETSSRTGRRASRKA